MERPFSGASPWTAFHIGVIGKYNGLFQIASALYLIICHLQYPVFIDSQRGAIHSYAHITVTDRPNCQLPQTHCSQFGQSGR